MDETDLWVQEHARLSKEVEKFFRQATTRFAVPTAIGCRMVASYLMALRGNPKKHNEKPKAVRFGTLFLRHLAAERCGIEQLVSLASQGRSFREEWLAEQQEILDRIDQTRRNIEWLLPALSPKPDPNRDPIRLIAATATEAWQETNGGRAPRSTNPDDPLCRFVGAALKAIGRQRSAAEVSEVLRGRRRKPKMGKIAN